MKTLSEISTEIGPRQEPLGPNARGMAQLMILVAMDVASATRTGRTYEMVEKDAANVMTYIMYGGQI